MIKSPPKFFVSENFKMRGVWFYNEVENNWGEGKMRVKIRGSKKRITSKYILCNSWLSKLRGLMFTKEEYVKKNLLIFEFKRRQRVDLHMMFVFYPIDVLFLDGRKRVVEIKEVLKPFSFYSSGEKVNYVIEAKQGSIFRNKIKKGEYLDW